MRKPKPNPNMTLQQSANYYGQIRKYIYHLWVLAKTRGEKTDFKTFYQLRKLKY